MGKSLNLYRKSMYGYSIAKRAEKIGYYLVETKCTVRKAASVFGISKTVVHDDVSKKLKAINPALWKEAKKVLKFNKDERHMRGGMVTKMRYSKKK